MPLIWQAVIPPRGDVVGALEAAAPQGARGGLVGAEVKASFTAEEEHHCLGDVHAMVTHRLEPIQDP